MWHGEFRDPRVAALHDARFGWTRADDFFVGLVNETPGARVADLGCGTGRLTLALAAAGHTVTGVDPARASLDLARAKPGAEAVRWVEGTSSALDDAAYDVVPGGRLFFDTRDPRARAWEDWATAGSQRVQFPDGTWVEIWGEITTVTGEVVEGVEHYRFVDGVEVVGQAAMRWRSDELLRRTLADAGFEVEQIYGGWSREPVGAPDGEFLVLARRRSGAENGGT